MTTLGLLFGLTVFTPAPRDLPAPPMVPVAEAVPVQTATAVEEARETLLDPFSSHARIRTEEPAPRKVEVAAPFGPTDRARAAQPGPSVWNNDLADPFTPRAHPRDVRGVADPVDLRDPFVSRP